MLVFVIVVVSVLVLRGRCYVLGVRVIGVRCSVIRCRCSCSWWR